MQNKLGLDLPNGIDLSKLIVSGHSFGGMTALAVAKTEPKRIKACLTLDPWLYAYSQDILNGTFHLQMPLQIVSTEMFHPSCDKTFESTRSVKALCEISTDRRHENITVANTGHLH